MIPPFEHLCKPTEPPPGPETVLACTHAAAVAQLREAATLLNSLATFVELTPWADAIHDGVTRLAGRALIDAQIALDRFKATRECGGSA